MGLPLLTFLLPALLLLLPGESRGGAAARPAAAASPKCLSCHGAERLPPHRDLSRALPAPADGWADCTGCHRGDGRTKRKELAHRGFVPAATARHLLPGNEGTARGRRILDAAGCRRCHVTGGTGIELAANLDRSVAALSPEAVARAIREPAAAMPDFRFGEGDAESLVRALLANGRGREGDGEAPRTVRFARRTAGGRERHPFAERCGPCHRALTERFGLLGEGTAGPDLSALFTPFHPGRKGNGAPWDGPSAAAWARNPRAVRPGALMPPPPLRKGEAEEALAALPVSPERVRR